jgi:hypothetical protein
MIQFKWVLLHIGISYTAAMQYNGDFINKINSNISSFEDFSFIDLNKMDIIFISCNSYIILSQ